MKKEKYFQLNQTAVEALAEKYGTPLLVLSLEQIEKNYNLLRTHMPRVKVFYAIKANPHRRILEALTLTLLPTARLWSLLLWAWTAAG